MVTSRRSYGPRARFVKPASVRYLRPSMPLRPILRFPDARLRQRSAEVTVVDDSVRQLVADMAESMSAADGAGLAAIQVGAPVRLFIVDGPVAGGEEGSPAPGFLQPPNARNSPPRP